MATILEVTQKIISSEYSLADDETDLIDHILYHTQSRIYLRDRENCDNPS